MRDRISQIIQHEKLTNAYIHSFQPLPSYFPCFIPHLFPVLQCCFYLQIAEPPLFPSTSVHKKNRSRQTLFSEFWPGRLSRFYNTISILVASSCRILKISSFSSSPLGVDGLPTPLDRWHLNIGFRR